MRSKIVAFIVVALALAGCGHEPASSPRSTTAGKPKAGVQSVEGQTAALTIRDGAFDVTEVNAKAGVVTLTLTNPSSTILLLAVRDGSSVIAEGGPASGAQKSTITIPVESGKTYEYFAPGHDVLVGTIVVS